MHSRGWGECKLDRKGISSGCICNKSEKRLMDLNGRSVSNFSQTFQPLLRYFSHARKNSWCCQTVIAMIIRVYHLGTMNFQTKIYLIIVEIFMFGPKWFTDRLANIGNHRKAAWIKKNKTKKSWKSYKKRAEILKLISKILSLCKFTGFLLNTVCSRIIHSVIPFWS